MTDLIIAFAKANPSEAATIINQYIAGLSDADEIAKLEVVREYICNPEFKQNLEDYYAA